MREGIGGRGSLGTVNAISRPGPPYLDSSTVYMEYISLRPLLKGFDVV